MGYCCFLVSYLYRFFEFTVHSKPEEEGVTRRLTEDLTLCAWVDQVGISESARMLLNYFWLTCRYWDKHNVKNKIIVNAAIPQVSPFTTG